MPQFPLCQSGWDLDGYSNVLLVVCSRPSWWLGTVLLEEQILCSVNKDALCRGFCVFAVDKQEAAKCGLVAPGLGRPLFFPHRSFLCQQEEGGPSPLATPENSSHDFTVFLRLRRISMQMTGVE